MIYFFNLSKLFLDIFKYFKLYINICQISAIEMAVLGHPLGCVGPQSTQTIGVEKNVAKSTGPCEV